MKKFLTTENTEDTEKKNTGLSVCAQGLAWASVCGLVANERLLSSRGEQRISAMRCITMQRN